MKHRSVASLLRYGAVAAFLLLTTISYSQVLTPRPTSISGTCGGYYEYLPQGYSTNTWQSYPVIIAVHGIGEIGNGTTDLGNLLNCWTAIPRLIANGGFPTSFSVGGQNFSFIVIAPQFNQWPYASDVNAVVDYAVSHYRVDQSRIYVTGLSMGGGSVWDFAGNYPTKAAAVVPVCGAASSDPTRAQAIANAKLPVWATHNQNDPTVSVSNTTGWVSLIGQYGWNIQSTIFNASGHDAWTQTYDPNFTQNGVNVYQWMLMHQKGSTTSTPPPTVTNQSPTANAGPNQTISLPTSTATLSGTGSDPDGTISFYQWNQTSGPSTAVIASPYSATTAVSGLAQGTYVFTLKVTDNLGATGTSNVTVTVNGSSAALVSSSTSTTRIEAENYINMYGVQKETTTDAGGGQDVGYIDYGDWMDYSVNVSSAGTYAVNLRLASPNGGQLQIQNSSGSVLATVTVPNTGGYQNWQTVSTNIALAAGTQTIRIYSTSNGWNINWWEIAGAGSSTTTSSSTTTASSTSTTHIEAENYANMNGVVKESTTDVGGGQDVGYIDYGDWMDYSVNMSSAGTYAVNLRLASPSGGQLQIQNSSGTVLATVSVPNTGGYQNWQTVSTNITLPAGSQTIRIYATSNGWNINWWEIAGAGSSTTTSASTTTASSTSTTHIEAENYTNMYGVQKESTIDVGGGQDVGYIDYGDWMDYSVNVSSAGTYAVNLRLASPNGGQLQFKDANGTVLATVTVPNTGGYQNWQTVSTNIALAAGTQTIRIYSTSNGWNINWWEIAGAGSSTTTTSSGGGTTHIEAENYANMNGVVKESTTDAGGGQDVGYIDYGDWMDYNVNVSAAGTYSVNLRVASPTGGQLQIKNSAGTVLATVNVPATGGWQNWQTVSTNISLSAGAQTVRVYSTSNGWNFNWWEISGGSGTVSAASVGKAEVVSSTALSTTPALNVYPNPIIDRFQLQVNNDLTGSVKVQVYDMQGSLQKQFALSKPDAGTSQFYLSIGQLPAATYLIKVTMNGWTESKQVIKK